MKATVGHYSPSTTAGGFLFLSAQLPVRPDGTHTINATFESQVRQALANAHAVLTRAGADWQHVRKVTAYIVGSDRWSTLNEVYADILGGARPARTVVPVSELHHGYLVAVDAIAYLRTNEDTNENRAYPFAEGKWSTGSESEIGNPPVPNDACSIRRDTP